MGDDPMADIPDDAPIPVEAGETVPDVELLVCDGETFRARPLSAIVGETGLILDCFGFAGSAIAWNWLTRHAENGWDDFEDVPLYGVSRDGPYAQNAFIRELETPFELLADVDARLIDALGLQIIRSGMAGVTTARRAIYVLEADRTVHERWVPDERIERAPVGELETAIESLSG